MRASKRKTPGKRTIKTAIAVIICIILSKIAKEVTGLEFVSFYACVTAVFTLQTSMTQTKKRGINRTMGTIIGASIALLFAFLLGQTESFSLYLIYIFIGTVLTIHVCYLFDYPDGVLIGCIMFLASTTVASDDYVMYTFIRILETLCGALVAVIVNKFIWPYKPENIENLD